jgi:uncharacterized protein with NAD-binding domain and iron-sulfur cluster
MAKVIILGGGIAGMSAAHELVERGFEVEIYEKHAEYVGGKARSVNVPGTNTNGANFLPGEHGFRFFPNFYKHITDTMSRIPYAPTGKTCFDNLVPTHDVEITQAGRPPVTVPVNFPSSPTDILEILTAIFEIGSELTKEELVFFSDRIWQLMTSCNDRFMDEYEGIGWWQYMQADDFSPAYRALLVEGLTRSLVAAKAQTASTRTVGAIFLQLVYGMLNNRDTDRVLNGPTNDVFLNPWLAYLQSKGVSYVKGWEVMNIKMDGDRVAGVSIAEVNGREVERFVTGDYYLMATPVEVAARLINPDMVKADASLQNIIALAPNVEWMNGIQFYLNDRFDMHRGHTIYSSSKWALTSISQLQFWDNYDIENRYDGTVRGVLSVDISNWTAFGNFNHQKAEDCTIEEVKEEVWAQLKSEINYQGAPILTDAMKRFVYLDSDIELSQRDTTRLMDALLTVEQADKLIKLSNREPLLVNQVNTWTLRPSSYTQIPNLFLASDYVKTYTDLATMEGANEAARRAVNNIITASGSHAELCELWELETPWVLSLLQIRDQKRFNKGLAWENPI